MCHNTQVGLSDISKYGLSVHFESLPTEETGGLFSSMKWLLGGKDKKKADEAVDDSEVWAKRTPLYGPSSPVPSKTKTVAFHHDKDILCRLEYDVDDERPLPAGTHPVVAVYNITGVAAFAKEAEGKGLGAPKVHLSFVLDASGMVQLTKAEATVDLPVEVPLEGANGAISSEDGSVNTAAADGAEGGEAANDENGGSGNEEESPVEDGEKGTESKDADKQEGESAPDDAKGEASSDQANKKSEDKKEKKDKKDKKEKKDKKDKKKDTVLRKTLTVSTNYDAVLPPQWSPAMLKAARAKLDALDAHDAALRAKAAALNDLEAYVYKIRSRLRDDDSDDKLGKWIDGSITVDWQIAAHCVVLLGM